MDPTLAVARDGVNGISEQGIMPQGAEPRIAVENLSLWPFREYPYLLWVTAFIVFSGGTTFFAWYSHDWQVYFRFCLLYAVGLLTVPVAFRICYRQFCEWAKGVPHFATPTDGSDIHKWLELELRFLNWSTGMWIAGIIVATVGLLSFLMGDYPVGITNAPAIFAAVTLFFSAFVAGMGLYGVFGGCRMIWRLGGFEIRVEAHKFGITSTGRMLLSCYFVIALTWSIYCLTAVLGLKHFTSGMSVGELYQAVKLPVIAHLG